MKYRQTKKISPTAPDVITNVLREDIDGLTWLIPFDLSNTDYQKFKSDVASGIELQDSDGNVMTQKQVNDFLKTIP